MDPDPGGPKTYGSEGSGSATQVSSWCGSHTNNKRENKEIITNIFVGSENKE
jgi:hypothetical protein